MPISDGSAAEQPESHLEQYAVGGLNGLYYIPNYLEPCQQDSLSETICSSKSRWTQVTNQRSNRLRVTLLHAIHLLAAAMELHPPGLGPKTAELWWNST